MLFQVNAVAGGTGPLLTALRAHDPDATISHDGTSAPIEVSARLTSEQVVAVLRAAGYEASRVSAPRQIHVSGGSDCCGSCS